MNGSIRKLVQFDDETQSQYNRLVVVPSAAKSSRRQPVYGSQLSRTTGFTVRPQFADLGLLTPGDRGRITAIRGEDPVAVRLLEMGLLPGESVEVIGVAPFGDPIAIRVRGTRLAIRRKDAARVTLELLASPRLSPAFLAPVSATT